MRGRTLFLLLVFGGIFVFGSLSFAAEVNNRIVAFVNNDIITLYEVHKEYRERTGANINEIMPDPKAYRITCERLIEIMINDLLTAQKEKEMNIEVSKGDIDEAIKDIEVNNGITREQLINELKRQGLTYEKFRGNIESDLKKRRIINYQVQQKILISDEEIVVYYNKNKKNYMQEEKIRLSVIFLPRNRIGDESEDKNLIATARNIINNVRRGESFAGLARTHSKGPGAADGGDMGYFTINQLDPALYTIIKDFKPGDITSPIVKDEGIYIIVVTEREGMLAKPVDELKEEIRRTLYREKVDQRYAAWLEELRNGSYIKVTF